MNFKLFCEICKKEVNLENIRLADRYSIVFVVADCECGNNAIIKIIDKKDLSFVKGVN